MVARGFHPLVAPASWRGGLTRRDVRGIDNIHHTERDTVAGGGWVRMGDRVPNAIQIQEAEILDHQESS
jgi:hypothetical protein